MPSTCIGFSSPDCVGGPPALALARLAVTVAMPRKLGGPSLRLRTSHRFAAWPSLQGAALKVEMDLLECVRERQATCVLTHEGATVDDHRLTHDPGGGVKMLMTTKPHWSRRNSLFACFVLAAALATAVLGGAAQPAAADSPATAVLDWNKHALDALANAPNAATPGAGQAAPVQALHLAMVQGAVYDAVNSIDGGHEAYLDGLPDASANASQAAAAATAARDVLVALLNQFPVCTVPPAVSCPAATSFTPAVRQAIIDRINGPLPTGSTRAQLLQQQLPTALPQSRQASLPDRQRQRRCWRSASATAATRRPRRHFRWEPNQGSGGRPPA